MGVCFGLADTRPREAAEIALQWIGCSGISGCGRAASSRSRCWQDLAAEHAAAEHAAATQEHVLLRSTGGAYFGMLNDSMPHGFGLELAQDGASYEGEWRRGIAHGSGRETAASGAVFSGTFVDGLRHGEGLAGPRFRGTPVYREVWVSGKFVSSSLEIPDSTCSEAGSTTSMQLPPSLPEEDCPPASWDAEEVGQWMQGIGLGRQAENARDAGVDGSRLLAMGHDQLENELGILRYGDRCRLLHEMRKAAKAAASTTAPAPSGTCPDDQENVRMSADALSSATPRSWPLFIQADQLRLPPPLFGQPINSNEVACLTEFTGYSVPIASGGGTGIALLPSPASQSGLAQMAGSGSPYDAAALPQAISSTCGAYLGKEVTLRTLRGRWREAQALKWHKTVRELEALRHPGLAQFLGVASPSGGTLCIVMERGSSLRSWMELQPDIAPGIAIVARGIAVAVEYLHNHGMWHRRLRPANVLLNEESLTVKVTDYASSSLEDCLEAPRFSRLRVCTPWTPPEVLRNTSYPASGSIDAYSFGVILWELLARRPPFEGLTPAQLVVAVGFAGRNLLARPRGLRRGLWQGLWRLTRDCLSHDPGARPSFAGARVALAGLDGEYSAREDALSAFFGF